MQNETAQMGENGRIVIPAAYRKALGLKGGDRLLLHMDENGIHIQSRLQALRRAQAIVRKAVPKNVSLSKDLITTRRREAEREASGR